MKRINTVAAHSRAQREAGFTLVELIVVFSIIALTASLVMLGFRSVSRSNDLDRSVSGVMELLRHARERTIASEGDTQWGVHMTSSAAMLFSGSSYLGVAEDTYTFPQSVTASWSLTGSGDDVVFERIDGSTINDGTITLTNAESETRVITLLTSGEFALIGVLPPETGTRAADTRHVHLELGYDLSTATTLQLTFIDTPNVVENITIADYVDMGQFVWMEEIDVNGNPEILRFVSHALSPETELSVRRDQDHNNTAVEIRVDGALIASYDVMGILTPGAGVTASVQ